MLQTIREKLTGWFAIFILGAIALTLVVTFGNIDTGFSGGSVAATVNGEDISQQEFRQLYDRQRQQWEASFQEQLPDVLAQTMADSVIQTLVRNRLLAGYVRDSGYRINDAEVIDAIQSNTVFHVGGKFSRPSYEQLLTSQGMSTQRFEFEQRQNMQIEQFVEGIGRSAFYTPTDFRRYIELDGETRDVNYMLLAAADWEQRVTIDPASIEAYYTANPAQFQTAERVDLEYIEIDYNQIFAATSVSDEDARAYFAANRTEFAGADERNVRHILIPFGADESAALKLAVELREQLDAGADFAELARANSADTGTAADGGDLGWLGVGDAPAAEFDTALFDMEPGDVSDPVRTEYGYHLILLEARRADSNVEFADIRDELMIRLREDRSGDRYGQLLDELDELALESLDGLKPVADTMGLELQQIKGFTRNGALPLGTGSRLVDTVFSLEVLDDGENSPIVELDDGRAVVVRVIKHHLPEQEPLDKVREKIAAQIRGNEAMLLAAATGRELVGKISAGADPAAIASEYSTEWRSLTDFRRGDQQLPVDLGAAIFKAPRPDDQPRYESLLLASGDFAIYQVVATNPGRPDVYPTEARDQRKQALADQMGSGQVAALIEALAESATVSVTPDLVGNNSDLL